MARMPWYMVQAVLQTSSGEVLRGILFSDNYTQVTLESEVCLARFPNMTSAKQ